MVNSHLKSEPNKAIEGRERAEVSNSNLLPMQMYKGFIRLKLFNSLASKNKNLIYVLIKYLCYYKNNVKK